MHRVPILFFLLACAFALMNVASAQSVDVMTGPQATLRAIDADMHTFVPPPAEFTANSNRVKTASIIVTYSGFTPEAQAAFQYAVDIWETLITSSVPIRVQANWTPLGPGILGSCGPTQWWRNQTGMPVASTWYPVALANKLHGSDLNTGLHDINANFSSTFTWYLGTDGNCPAGQYDFVTVVLHELCHGLGFLGLMGYDSSTGQGGWGDGTGNPGIYDRYTVNGGVQSLINTSLFPNPSVALGNQLKSNNIYWNGPNGIIGAGGARPKLYAPSSWNGGSSYAHLDEATYPAGNPNSLETPAAGSAEAIHTPGPITMGMFRDWGWTTPNYTPRPDLWIKTIDDASYIGDNVYNTTGASQTRDMSVLRGASAYYYTRLYNDNTASDSFRVTATAADANFYVVYYYWKDSAWQNISTDITSANGWQSPSLPAGNYALLLAQVVPTGTAPFGTIKTCTITARSQGSTTAIDVVKANTKVKRIQPDGLVRNVAEASYTGDNIYNTTGAGQTTTANPRPNVKTTFYARFYNDGNENDIFTIRAYPGAAEYHAQYFNNDTGADITTAITSADGWKTSTLVPNNYAIVRLEVTPDSTASGSVTQNFNIWAISDSNTSYRDTVVAAVKVAKDRPDLWIKTIDDASYIGDNIYNSTGVGQMSSMSVYRGANAYYYLRLYNDGNVADSIKMTASAGDSNFTVTYYYWVNSAWSVITDDITSANGWTSPSLAPGSYALLLQQVVPSASAAYGSSKVCSMLARSVGTSSLYDLTKSVTYVKRIQPDGWIRKYTTEYYLGNDIYNTDGAGQTVADTPRPNQKTIFYARFYNDGTQNDVFTVRGYPGAPEYHGQYFDGTSTTNITTAITSTDGWSTGTIAPGGYRLVRLEVTPDSTASGTATQNFFIWAISNTNTAMKDTVVASVKAAKDQPDGLIKSYGDASYIGNNIYNTSGAGQTKSQVVVTDQTATFYVIAQNDGNVNDRFKVTGWPGAPGFHVTYHDYNTSADITAAVTSANGWISDATLPGYNRVIVVQSTPDSTISAGTTQILPVIITSVGTPAKVDVVRAVVSTLNYQPDMHVRIASDTAFVGDNIYNSTGTDQTRDLSVTAAAPAALFWFRVQNDGNTADSFRILGSTAASGWAIKYYTSIGNTDVTADLTNGTGALTVSLAPGGTVGLWGRVEATSAVPVGGATTFELKGVSVTDTTLVDIVKVNVQKN